MCKQRSHGVWCIELLRLEIFITTYRVELNLTRFKMIYIVVSKFFKSRKYFIHSQGKGTAPNSKKYSSISTKIKLKLLPMLFFDPLKKLRADQKNGGPAICYLPLWSKSRPGKRSLMNLQMKYRNQGFLNSRRPTMHQKLLSKIKISSANLFNHDD